MTVIKDLSQATPAQMQALQAKELEILKYLKQVCDANGLSFFLAGGSCIGALRHHGFIPWDDDVDVFMMREDYERLARDWSKLSPNPQYELCRSDATHNYRHAAMTLNDSETTFINFRTADQDVNQGIGIDILPMDRLATSAFARFKQRANAVIFSIYINQRLPDHQGKLLRMLTGLPLALVKSPKRRYQLWHHAEARMIKPSLKASPAAVELVTGLKAIMRPLDAAWFEQTQLVPFEDTQMPVPIGYDQYLTLIFGDYMSFPPKSDQKAKHHTAIIDTERSYREYKGQYYLVED
ncbi:phosphorylcholine transferase LicD [Lacticaseibacillus baoqingensis]|uniref:Phosphorylcholine transferase LicD n=1 Tax=Lacticaseibacillus baoqingensis TaxID=2486013 RepID=A0ABW4E5L1_9LACO|nr:LicD family protein [Lacticaseibacillus baoqingensis]